MKYFLIIFIPLILIITSGCENKQVLSLINPSSDIEAEVIKRNSDNDFTSTIDYVEEKQRISKWFEEKEGQVKLVREITFDVYLENGEKLHIGFVFSNIETNMDLLILHDEDKNIRKRHWDYKHTEDEITNFYKDGSLTLEVDNTGKFYPSANNNGINIEKIARAEVNSEEKTFLQFTFEGETFGWYDPTGEFMNVFEIKDGIFSGVIE